MVLNQNGLIPKMGLGDTVDTNNILRQLRQARSAYYASLESSEKLPHRIAPETIKAMRQVLQYLEMLDGELSRGALLPDAWSKSVIS